MRTRIAVTLILGACTVSAQVSNSGTSVFSGSGTGTSFRGSATFGPPAPFARHVVTGGAYSGEEVSEHVQTLADGTRLTQKNTQRKIYRDSQGRTRTERPAFGAGGNRANMPDLPMVVEIVDPVAGVQYILDTQTKVAHRQVLPAAPPAPGQRGGRQTAEPMAGGGGGTSGVFSTLIPGPVPTSVALAAPAGTSQPRPNFATEKIGTQTIDGVTVEGTRTTVTYPVGMMGNDREFSTTSETWMARDLNLMMLSKSNDPRSGESTFRIANFSRAEPEASLFMVPTDYTVVDEKGSFTINYGSTGQ